MRTGPLFEKVLSCLKRIIVCQGGGDAGKTVAILQVLAIKAIQEPGIIITVEGEDIPNLRAGALRTFQRYVLDDKQVSDFIYSYNKTERIYTFKNGSIIEFKSFEDEQDARGSERDYLYMNECNSRSYNLFWQLQRKTRKQIFLDYNPTTHFWVHEKLLAIDGAGEFRDKVQLYITDHRHNPFLTEEEHAAYENISDGELFKVYSRGLTGMVKGLIFSHFKKIEVFPDLKELDRIIWGIDYGYTNDPTALVKIGVKQRKRYHKECCYLPGISAERIVEILKLNDYKGEDIYSEADPNMINQLRILGMNVYPAIKGPGSLVASISKVKEYECYYTEDSINFEKEIRTWKWMIAQDITTGKEVMTNVPIDGNDHCCAASRYGIYTDSYRGAA